MKLIIVIMIILLESILFGLYEYKNNERLKKTVFNKLIVISVITVILFIEIIKYYY